MIRFRMLGTLDLRDAQDRELRTVLRRPKLLALLGYLAVARPHGFHRRDGLVTLLWPELDTAHARNALRQAVHALRSALGPEVVLARGEEELGVSGEHLWCDVRELEAALAAGEAERCLELYRGALLSGFHLSAVPEFERWLDEEREGVRHRVGEAARLLADRDAATGNPAGAVRWARRLTELSPYDETAVQRLVGLLDHLGDRAGAVRAYEEFERRLGRDLEVAPSPETRLQIAGIRARQEEVGSKATRTGVPSTGAPVAEAEAWDGSSARATRRPPWARPGVRLRLAVTLSVVLGAGWLLFGASFRARNAVTAREPKRLVVLPFSNLGPADAEYFADGITEEITARLAVIGDLRVIGSTSAQVYKGTRKTLQQVGRELGVDYVLEGSVRWQRSTVGPARVRVTPQLVRTADDTHLWAEVYDEPLDQVFRVQSDIARKVVQALDLTLLEPQRRAVEAVPTRNLEAYDYYLRGNDYVERGTADARAARAAVRMYERAVELDPNFALAFAMLSRLHSRFYLFYYDRSAERLAMAKGAVDRALELEPGLPEAHHSLATYYYIGQLDYERALREFATAAASRPNDYRLLQSRAVLRVRQGKVREALVDFERSWQLDPRNAGIANQYAQAHDLLRDFPRAEALYDRAIALAPDRAVVYFWKAWLYLRWDGTTQRARAVLDEARTAGVGDDTQLRFLQILVELFDRRYADAIARLSAETPEVIEGQVRVVPSAQLYAQVYGLTGRSELERACYDSARSYLAGRVDERPEDARLRGALGIAYAGLGRKEEAIQEGERGVELLPISKEAYQGYYRVLDLARIYAMVGAHDAAIDRLEHLLSIPGHLTPGWLRIDPAWDPLRGHARFQRLLASRK